MNQISSRQDRLLHDILDVTTAAQHIVDQTCEELDGLSRDELETQNERYYRFYSRFRMFIRSINRTLRDLYDVDGQSASSRGVVGAENGIWIGADGITSQITYDQLRANNMSDRVRMAITGGEHALHNRNTQQRDVSDVLDKIIFHFKMRCGELRDTMHQIIRSYVHSKIMHDIQSYVDVYHNVAWEIPKL